MLDLSTPQSFKPLKNNRRSELIAWLFAILLVVVKIMFPAYGFFRIGGSILALFFLFSAVIMSIGNWVSRNSELRISEKGIWYFNGARKSSFHWKDIIRVEVYSGRFNDRINVVSTSGNIYFDIIGDGVINERKFSPTGYADGEEILETILNKTNLIGGQKQKAQGYYYYSKE
jgi:hypothetical protein